MKHLILACLKLAILVILFIFPVIILTPVKTSARVNPEDVYQASRVDFEANLAKIQDPAKKAQVIQADQLIQTINQNVSNEYLAEIDKMAAILDEEKSRQHITSTRVAYGMGSTPMDTAEYYVNYAEEAVAFQKIQNYTPNISGGNLAGGVRTSLNNLMSNLETVRGKVLKAKSETSNALNYYEK